MLRTGVLSWKIIRFACMLYVEVEAVDRVTRTWATLTNTATLEGCVACDSTLEFRFEGRGKSAGLSPSLVNDGNIPQERRGGVAYCSFSPFEFRI